MMTFKRNIVSIISTFAASILIVAHNPSLAKDDQKLPLTQLSVGLHLIRAEVAASNVQRQQGLMNRDKMAQNEGMLFVFDAPAQVCMWMKNTRIPLSVAFIDLEGKIVNIEDMKPHSLESHCGKKLVRYALEMNRGWFQQRNIEPGSQINGLPKGR